MTAADDDRATIYVTDLDGTLLNPSGELTMRSAAVLTALILRGMRCTVATARSWGSTHRALDRVPLTLPLVVYSGAMAVAPATGERLWWVPIEAEVATAVIGLAESHGVTPMVFWLQDGQDRVSWVGETAASRAFQAERPGDRRMLPVGRWDELDPEAVFFLSVIGPARGVRAVEAAIGEAPWAARCARALAPHETSFADLVLDVTAANATKAHGVQRVAAEFGDARLVVLGDGANDLPLFAVADEAWAVANAEPAVRASATGVIGADDADGVAVWLEQHARF